jgi:signal transduction histidine kinase
MPPASSSPETQFEAAILAWTQELAPHGLLTTDRDLRITSWNAWLETHSGIRTVDAIGQPLLELFSGLVARRLDERFKRALVGEVAVLSSAFHGYLFPFPSTLQTNSVPHMLQTARIAPLLVGADICGTITMVEDVTQREHDSAALRRQEVRDRLLSGALQQLIEAPDPKLVLPEVFARLAVHLGADVFVNTLATDASPELRLHAWAGLTPDEQKTLTNAAEAPEPGAGPVSARVVDPALPALDLKARWRSSLQVADRLLGEVFFGSRTRERFDPSELEFGQLVCRYVTVALDRALAEQQLRKAHSELEARVEERTALLQETVGQLESFSYTLAHDLRAPLRTLRGYAEVLLEDGGDTLLSLQRQYLAKIRVAATGMELLTRDLLDFSKISRERLELTRIDLDELLQDIVLMTPALQPAGVLTIQSPLPLVIGQWTLLRQALANLLNNALKFVAPGVAPRVTVRAELRAPCAASARAAARPAFQSAALECGMPAVSAGAQEVVRLWVEDRGIGIDPQDHRKIFGVFERLHSREGYEGTGVGLAIVARSVQRGGVCGVESELGQGSRFWIELPKG